MLIMNHFLPLTVVHGHIKACLVCRICELKYSSLRAQWQRICHLVQEMQVRSLSQEDSPGEGNVNSFQYSCLGNPMDRGPWLATVHGLTKESDTT